MNVLVKNLGHGIKKITINDPKLITHYLLVL